MFKYPRSGAALFLSSLCLTSSSNVHIPTAETRTWTQERHFSSLRLSLRCCRRALALERFLSSHWFMLRLIVSPSTWFIVDDFSRLVDPSAHFLWSFRPLLIWNLSSRWHHQGMKAILQLRCDKQKESRRSRKKRKKHLRPERTYLYNESLWHNVDVNFNVWGGHSPSRIQINVNFL